MMKRIFALLLALVMLFALAACQEEKPGTTDPSGATGDAPNVDRKEVDVLSGIAAINLGGGKAYEYKWETLERRLMTNMTATVAGSTINIAFAYREGDRMATATGLSDGVTITISWDEAGQVTSVLETSSGGTHEQTFTYNEAGLLTERVVLRDGQQFNTTTYTYNEKGALLQEQTKMRSGIVTTNKTYAYNEQGDVIEETSSWKTDAPVVRKYTYTYGDNGKPTTRITLDGEGTQIGKNEYTYDESGRLTVNVAQSGESKPTRTEYVYGENGLIAQEKQYLTGNKVDRTTEYTYTKVRMTDAEYALYNAMLDYSRDWY